jgi:hypothetical protein
MAIRAVDDFCFRQRYAALRAEVMDDELVWFRLEERLIAFLCPE